MAVVARQLCCSRVTGLFADLEVDCRLGRGKIRSESEMHVVCPSCCNLDTESVDYLGAE